MFASANNSVSDWPNLLFRVLLLESIRFFPSSPFLWIWAKCFPSTKMWSPSRVWDHAMPAKWKVLQEWKTVITVRKDFWIEIDQDSGFNNLFFWNATYFKVHSASVFKVRLLSRSYCLCSTCTKHVQFSFDKKSLQISLCLRGREFLPSTRKVLSLVSIDSFQKECHYQACVKLVYW